MDDNIPSTSDHANEYVQELDRMHEAHQQFIDDFSPTTPTTMNQPQSTSTKLAASSTSIFDQKSPHNSFATLESSSAYPPLPVPT